MKCKCGGELRGFCSIEGIEEYTFINGQLELINTHVNNVWDFWVECSLPSCPYMKIKEGLRDSILYEFDGNEILVKGDV